MANGDRPSNATDGRIKGANTRPVGNIGVGDAKATAIVEGMDLPGGVRIVQGGERSEMVQSFRDLAWAMVLAILLVYMILAAQFESFLDPLLIGLTGLLAGCDGTAAAAETDRLSTPAARGTCTERVAALAIAGGSPLPSAPRRIADGPVKSF